MTKQQIPVLLSVFDSIDPDNVRSSRARIPLHQLSDSKPFVSGQFKISIILLSSVIFSQCPLLVSCPIPNTESENQCKQHKLC
jgi:hypothetical protein